MIFSNPLWARKVQTSKNFNNNNKVNKLNLNLFKLEIGNIIGEDDVIGKKELY